MTRAADSRNSLPERHATLYAGWLLALGCADAAAVQYSEGPYTSIQVNVDAAGRNIPGDAANETTIAINPVNPANIVIGWRQFNTVTSPDVQGGWAYTNDGGANWHFPGTLPSLEGQLRTDPVLDVDSAGNFYYQSLAHGSVKGTSVFKSEDGGKSWQAPVHMFDGDKNWMIVDRTGGASDGHIYSTWRDDPKGNNFIRSTNAGATFDAPLKIPVEFGFGTLAVGPNGELFVVGRNELDEYVDEVPSRSTFHPYFFFKSENARDASATPSFSVQALNMGGAAATFHGGRNPNKFGTNGDAQVAVDRSKGPMRGNVYVLANLDPPGEDNLDIHFIRSGDGGKTWSEPVRVNDDKPSADHWQWFAMMGVADNSRIDAAWYDTRDSGNYKVSRLYYAYSWDGGVTWSKNRPVSPPFDTHVGLPARSSKIGDYTHLRSDRHGAHIAYAATFNGEQDVYYLNVFPDCNGNGTSDVRDIESGKASDANANHIPDACETNRLAGDLDGDGDVDRRDIDLLLSARNQPASGPDDPRDIDGNGTIDMLDARKLTLSCTRPRCATE
ncbi:hypothetical protein sS8_4505 [Methylocaldum marinum]|uniref:Exo-alpha-sialidase n=1 Tax=Methylocaldum marinum TaxID=1432792 RepID=A0A250KXT7_9GAMM|nr:sialidase family protein [Methylocaldum marinum]BBA36435.1 hypothetical protein sS8_4505 [Methylocaldum marinum]